MVAVEARLAVAIAAVAERLAVAMAMVAVVGSTSGSRGGDGGGGTGSYGGSGGLVGRGAVGDSDGGGDDSGPISPPTFGLLLLARVRSGDPHGCKHPECS